MFQFNPVVPCQRRGAVLVFALVMLVVLLGFGSLTLDVGAMYNARADLQNAADAAALAGASMLADKAMIPIRLGNETSTTEIYSSVFERSSAVASRVTSFGGKNIVLESGDVAIGWIDTDSSNSGIDLTQAPSKLNAVHVVAKRTKESANGPVELFFASIFGKSTTDVTASATAAFDDRMAGFDLATGPTLFPFTIHLDTYQELIDNNVDAYEYDDDSKQVVTGGDGVPEVDIFPNKLQPGNFGRLAIGSEDVVEQILTGVTPEDIQMEIGKPTLNFYDDDGNPLSYTLYGDTGLKASLEDEIASRVGDVVGIFVHSAGKGTGNNANFKVVGIRFVRVMDVSLKSGGKGMWLQPVSYVGSGVIVSSVAPSSGGVAGQMVLVR